MKAKTLTNAYLGLFLGLAGTLHANEDTGEPQGRLTPILTQVLEGSKVDLEWNISYPPTSPDPVVDTEVTVQFITLAIGPRWTVRFGTTLDGVYTEFYDGVSEEHEDYALTPGTVVARTFRSHDAELGFRARHARTQITESGGWVDSNDPLLEDNIISLVDGDPVPSVPPVSGQRSVADILQPYSENGFIKLGPTQRILVFELFTTDMDHHGFDIQDLILLVTHQQIDVTEE